MAFEEEMNEMLFSESVVVEKKIIVGLNLPHTWGSGNNSNANYSLIAQKYL